MKSISFYRIPAWLAKVTIDVGEDKVLVTGKNLLHKTTVEFNYKEFVKYTVRGKQGDVDWLTAGRILLAIFLVLVIFFNIFFPNLRHSFIVQLIEGMIFLASLTSFLLPFIIQEEYVWFHAKDKDVAFSIKITKKNRGQAEKIIGYMSNKISEETEST